MFICELDGDPTQRVKSEEKPYSQKLAEIPQG